MIVRPKSWIVDVDRTAIKPRDPDQLHYTRLDKSERIIPFPQSFFDSFKQQLTQEDFICYPNSYELRERLAKHNNLRSSQIFLSAGSDQIIKAVYETFVDKSDRIVTTLPSFPMYKVYGELCNATMEWQPYHSNHTELYLPVFDLCDRIATHKPKLVVLANPNNPIGDVISNDQLRTIAQEAARVGAVLLIDEAYYEFAEQSAIELLSEFDNVCIARTFSKALGGAGLRIGYLMGQESLIELVSKFRMMYDTNGVAIKFATHILDNMPLVDSYVAETIEQRERVAVLLKQASYDVISSYTNWIHFNDTQDNKQAAEILQRNKVLYKSGTKIPFDNRSNWIRLTVGPGITTTTYIKELLSR